MSLRLSTGLLVSLCVLFLGYSVSLYFSGNVHVKAVAEGRLVWQKYNCQSCHQLYGLGGYLGPDLTNVTSTPGKDENYLRGMILSGTGRMPAFPLEHTEMTQLLQFLQAVDKTGDGRIGTFRVHGDGMISEQHE